MGTRSAKTLGGSPAGLFLYVENADKVVAKATSPSFASLNSAVWRSQQLLFLEKQQKPLRAFCIHKISGREGNSEEMSKAGNVFRVRRVQVVKTHGPIGEVPLWRDALKQCGNFGVPFIQSKFFIKREHLFLFTLQDLQEVSALEQQHPGNSQGGIVLSSFREKFPQILL